MYIVRWNYMDSQLEVNHVAYSCIYSGKDISVLLLFAAGVQRTRVG